MRLGVFLGAVLPLLATGNQDSPVQTRPVAWIPWSDDVFARAQREKRLVLLDLQAVWCHWCHVMEETTYRDPEVARIIAEHYLAVQVDQDSRPDLSNRYEDYGWPATIVFRGDGVELAKRSGYIPPKPMASMLQAFVDDPTPGPSAPPTRETAGSGSTSLSPELRAELERIHASQFDREHGGWGFANKWLDPPSVEYSLARRRNGEKRTNGGKPGAADGAADPAPGFDAMARRTLDAALALVDPVWGGVYQYSTGGDFKEPHFEKIMSFQADDLRIYALAHATYRDARYRDAAQAIHRFLHGFLTGQGGAFFTSMDADLVQGEHSGEYFALSDAERRKRGVPRIDTHTYARENGWAIRGLAGLYAWTGDESALSEARTAAEWILAHRTLPGGGFRHGESDPAGPYLGDTLAMGQAFLALHETTGERRWLVHAEQAAEFLGGKFAAKDAGFVTAAAAATPAASAAPAFESPRNRGENIDVARFANLLFRYTGKDAHRKLAEAAMRYVSTPEIAKKPFTSGVLLADLEMSSDPLHVVVVGKKSDAKALALFRAALALPSSYRRIEWWDPAEGPLPNAGTEYPELDRPAAFACAGGRCSSPAYEAADVSARVEALSR
jgi:uncharacterized protein YyaL (SSP411 family)